MSGLTGAGTHASEEDHKLPRSARIQKSAEYRRILSTNQKGRTRYFRYCLAPGACSGSRIGITVSRRVSGSSVQRNRIKRQVREFFRNNRVIIGGYDLVVTGVPGAASRSNRELREDLKRLWEKLDSA